MIRFVRTTVDDTPELQSWIHADPWHSYNSYTSSNGSYVNGDTAWMAPVAWLQVQDDGTNYYFRVAVDGQNFKTLLTESRTNFLTTAANQIGIFIDPINSTYVTDAVFVHWAGI